jgi:hypothetical protein
MNEAGECPRCKPFIEDQARAMPNTGECHNMLERVKDLLWRDD